MATDLANEMAGADRRPSHERITVKLPEAEIRAVLEACRDTEREYKNGATDARDATFRALFTHFAQQRAQFSAALADLLDQAGDPRSADGPSVANVFRRGMADLRAALEGNSDFAILANCLKAEEAALLAYERALAGVLPGAAREVLRGQHASLNEAVAEVIGLRR